MNSLEPPRAFLILTLLFAILHGCDNGASDTARGVNVRDSAGIRIVENHSPVLASDRAWTVSQTPLVEIGGNESDSTQTLNQVEKALQLGSGLIVLVHGSAPAVRWYDAKGAFVQGTGRFGQGPGEFDSGEGAIWIADLFVLPGDSIATYEHSKRRIQVFDPKGKFVRSAVMELPPGMHELAYPQISGQIDGGYVLMLLDERETGELRVVRRDSVAFLRYTNDGKYARSLGRVPGFTRYVVELPRPGTSGVYRTQLGVPFGPVFVSWPYASRFYYGSGEQNEIAVFDTSGTVRMLVRRTAPRRVVTSEMAAQYKESRMKSAAASGGDPMRVKSLEDQLNALPAFADSLPPYRRIRVDREGMLWVQDYNLAGEQDVSWSVFDQQGRWLSDVTVPLAWRIVDIGKDYILAVETDSLDVERVRKYQLNRRVP